MLRPRLIGSRDFRLLWVGETLSELGSQSAMVAYPLLVLSLTGSPTKAGAVGLAKWLPLALFSLPAGVLADRFNRKHLMIACDVLRMLGATSIVVALVLGQPAYAQIVLVAFLDGTLYITSYICERGALAHVVETDQLQDAVAQNEARLYAAGIVGPSLGGVLFAIAQALPFAADAASFMCSTAAITATRTRFQTAPSGGSRTWRALRTEVREGFSWLWSRPFFRTTALLFAIGNPVFTSLYLLAILLARLHHASAAMIGVMFTIGALGGLLGAFLAAPVRRAVGVRGLIAGGPWLVLGVVLLMLVTHDPVVLGLLLGLAEFSAPPTNAVVAGSRIAAAPDHLRGRIQAVASTMSMSLAWLGPLAIGYLFEQSGPTSTILAVAGWTLALALAATLAPSIRHYAANVRVAAAVQKL